MNQQPKMKRIAVYLDPTEYSQLRASLVLQHTTVSEWIRQVIKDFLKQPK